MIRTSESVLCKLRKEQCKEFEGGLSVGQYSSYTASFIFFECGYFKIFGIY